MSKQQIYTEGVFGFLLKFLSKAVMGRAFKSEIKRIEKNHPEAKDNLNKVVQNTKELESVMKRHCEMFPDDDICKPGGWEKYYETNKYKASN